MKLPIMKFSPASIHLSVIQGVPAFMNPYKICNTETSALFSYESIQCYAYVTDRLCNMCSVYSMLIT
jgi:hypothetical protein